MFGQAYFAFLISLAAFIQAAPTPQNGGGLSALTGPLGAVPGLGALGGGGSGGGGAAAANGQPGNPLSALTDSLGPITGALGGGNLPASVPNLGGLLGTLNPASAASSSAPAASATSAS